MTGTRPPSGLGDVEGLGRDQAMRPMLARLSCMINRHRPTRGQVQWEGTCYLATCRHCSKKIVRHKGTPWRKI